jgi:hypothetical protein
MSEHLHTAITPGCYRCDLNLDELASFKSERRDKVTAILSAYADDAQAAADAVLDMLDEEGYL